MNLYLNPSRITVPSHLLSSHGGDHYVLRVVGDSMVSEGILDGDYVIVLRRTLWESGEMAVILVGDEASIKRLYLEDEGKSVRLQPANRDLPSITLSVESVKVQGIVVGIMRKC